MNMVTTVAGISMACHGMTCHGEGMIRLLCMVFRMYDCPIAFSVHSTATYHTALHALVRYPETHPYRATGDLAIATTYIGSKQAARTLDCVTDTNLPTNLSLLIRLFYQEQSGKS